MNQMFDPQALLERVDHDYEFLTETVDMLRESGPELLGQIRQAVEAGDCEALTTAAHTYKGMVANFCADSNVAAALRLETMGKSGDLTGAEGALALLEDLGCRLMTALQELLRDNAP
ncbi:MAG: Hpt domain-containing protein [Thermoguttaceae bacterium]